MISRVEKCHNNQFAQTRAMTLESKITAALFA